VALKENRKGGNLKRKKKRTTALLGFLVFSRKSLKTQTRSTKEKNKRRPLVLELSCHLYPNGKKN
jgi:hypothetical protein